MLATAGTTVGVAGDRQKVKEGMREGGEKVGGMQLGGGVVGQKVRDMERETTQGN